MVGPAQVVTRTVVDADKHVVDGLLTGGPIAVGAIAGALRRLQNGYARTYALSVLSGAVIVIAALLAVNLA